MRLSKKLAALAVVAGVAVTASAAFAYWTTGGSGSGSASVGSATGNLTVTASPATGAGVLIPAGAAVPLNLAVSNPNGYSVALHGHGVSMDEGSIKCDDTSVPDSWFSIDDAEITNLGVVGPKVDNVNGSGTLDPSGVTVKMNNDTALNQDVCQDAVVSFELSVD